ncbi:MAG: hypothetical protein HGA38_03055 [Candidatus Moranbacteria bacterium]|nr:hypothetical protein [Candidatus Moranbacteria bacterium]NTW46357.1 hypothetical protein [Candidatus Moranbacteria bacterium]
MVKRFAATKELLNLSVMGVQFVAGIRFLIGMFDSDETVRKLWASIAGTFGEMGHVLPYAATGMTDMTGPPAALLLILGFMGFSYVLFTMVPGVVARMEREDDETPDD